MDKAEAITKLKRNFPIYSQNVLRVVNKAGRLVPFKLNDSQLHMHRTLVAQKKEKGRARILVLKARQTGISTYTEGRYFWKTTQTPNCSTFVLSHLQESTSAIFRMVTTFYDSIPDPAFKPALDAKTLSMLRFQGLNSQYRVGTAKTGQTGRSMTNQLLHGSEVAFYPDQDLITAGVLQTVGLDETEVIMESTANGVGGWFYDRCMECLDGKDEWQLVFIPWHQMKEYRLPVPEDFVRSEEEVALADLYSLDNKQLMFRRSKITELGSEDLFKQEYPGNPREAFLTSGRSVVGQSFIDAAEAFCVPPIHIATVGPGGVHQSPYGQMKVWEEPKKEKDYVIGVDVAEGLEHGDYSVAEVVDRDGKQIACWRGHIDPLDFGYILNTLGRHYNKAYMLIERNNHGLTTLRKTQELGYPRLYVEQQIDYAYGDKLTKKAGWLTTTKTKPVIIDGLVRAIVQSQSGIVDKDLIQELRTYVVDDRGRTNAMKGCFDDQIMAYAIARYGTTCMPRRRLPSAPRTHNPIDEVVGY